MKHLISVLALIAALGGATTLPAQAGGFQFNFSIGGEPRGGNEGDEFGILCQTERGLRNILADRGYTHILMGVVNDDYHRVVAKAARDGATYRVLLNSCTGKIIDRERV